MHKTRKKIAYITGTRADFGLMSPVLSAIEQTDSLSLNLYATGIHLMPKFGRTIREVTRLFPKTKIIPATFQKDTREGMVNFAPQFMKNLIRALTASRPDFVLTLGDRIEMLCTATACLYLGIPTGQLHGGETTATVDEVARHAITKLSHLHFPATKLSASRIAAMGEESWRINVVGAPALDIILNQPLPSRQEVFKYLSLQSSQSYILVTQHAVSESWKQSDKQIRETIQAVKSFNIPVVMTYPNADAGGRKIIREIEKERKNPLFRILPSSQYRMFLAMEREAAVWIGNSSAAMIESSSFRVPVVNIGERQLGRQRGDNVIDVSYTAKEIAKAIKKSLSDTRYHAHLRLIRNPWGDGKTGPRVARILSSLNITPRLLNKRLSYA